MFIKKILLLLLLLWSCYVNGQNIKSEESFRLIKTAGSLMEAQQFTAAEQYFKKGLDKAKASNDFYSQASAKEGLGNLYTKTDQLKQAIECYRQAINLYRAQGLTVMANIVESLLKSAQGFGDLYAGIEIGAKGIKMSVIDVKLTKEREYDYTLKGDTSINTDAASLSYQSEKETFDAITILYEMITKRYAVPSARISIVISSGLKQELDKYQKVEYFANIIRPKSLDPKIKITYVTSVQESELSFRGIVPEKNRFTTDQLDVGSGNTKGGYFNADKVFVPLTFPIGTKSFQRLIESKSQGNLEEYLKTAEQILDDSLARLMVYEFSNKQEFKSRDVVYLSGGIVWAVASFMHPDKINSNYVEITSRDIADFRSMIFSNYDKITQPDVTLISNIDDARASLRNLNRVMKTYDQKALLAGAIWLDELIQQVNTINPSKKFIYHKYAYVGWISGYILEKVKKQYSGLALN